MLADWLAATPPEWGLADPANADGKILGAALPMGFNRVPHYTRGVLLVGDSGGMVNPFNGEGIAVRDGVRASWPPRSRCRRWPGRPGPARERALAATRPS